MGGYVALSGLWAAPISGASMNPVRSLASDLLRGDVRTRWIYVVGPIVGAMIGVAFEWILKGKPTEAGRIAAGESTPPIRIRTRRRRARRPLGGRRVRWCDGGAA